MKTRNIILGIVCLLVGCCMYLLLRSESIRLYQWVRAAVGTAALDSVRAVTMGWAVPDFVRFSVPDGLWCAAYGLIADGIWGSERGWARHVVVTLIPAVALVHECLQLAGLVGGTFDVSDVVVYALPLAAYYLHSCQ